MSFAQLASLPVRARRVAARHRWVRFLTPVLLGLGTYAIVVRADDAATAARSEWGDLAEVWVASAPADAGDELAAVRRAVPRGLVPDGAAPADRDVVGATARRPIGANEIVVVDDLDHRPAPLALVPEGWLVVPIVESPASGAAVGERIVVATDGVVLAAEALVVEAGDARTRVAVPAAPAPMVAAAAGPSGPGLVVLRTGG
jgi:hypothetical protein